MAWAKDHWAVSAGRESQYTSFLPVYMVLPQSGKRIQSTTPLRQWWLGSFAYIIIRLLTILSLVKHRALCFAVPLSSRRPCICSSVLFRAPTLEVFFYLGLGWVRTSFLYFFELYLQRFNCLVYSGSSPAAGDPRTRSDFDKIFASISSLLFSRHQQPTLVPGAVLEAPTARVLFLAVF